ncbi:MAG: cation:proton antiporter, partial [Fimbriimonadaceae bacterium]|nr:cation:proton antiporter [Alphaproteobacteria bacterium]
MNHLEYLALIWIAVFVGNVVARKTKLTPVVWFLALGSLMVNIGVLPTTADEFISGLAELGIILIMFALGFEEETSNFISSLKKSWGIALFGALAPFTGAYLLADYIWNDANIALMCGLTMTATAVSLTMLSLQEVGLGKSALATRIMTSAVLDDIASLALIAILVPVASGHGAVDIGGMAIIVGKVIVFFVLVMFLGAWLFPHQLRGRIARIPILRSFGVQHLLAFGRHSTLTVLLLALIVGLVAHEFGFHPAVGAYMA